MSDDKIISLVPKTSPRMGDEEEERVALETMQECLTLIRAKVDAGEVDGFIVVSFNKNNTSEDYMAGRLSAAEVTHVLQCLMLDNVLMTQIERKDYDR